MIPQSVKCFFGVHKFFWPMSRKRLRVCTACRTTYTLEEVVVNNVRTGRWLYAGTMSVGGLDDVVAYDERENTRLSRWELEDLEEERLR